MKRVLALLGSILLALSSSQASLIISQTNNFSNGIFGASYDWLQFDGTLGTLTSAVVSKLNSRTVVGRSPGN